MTASQTAIDQFWFLLLGALTLDAETFRQIHQLPLSWVAALLVVFTAGLSQAIGQSVVLFINRVRPIPFALTLLITAVLFVFSYGFWAGSTWLIARVLFQVHLPLIEVIQTLGFSYTPLLFGLLVVLPYFGIPIFIVLSIWTLLALVSGLEAISSLGRWQAFECCVEGWVALQLIQRTIGRPIAVVVRRVVDRIAGVKLITDRASLRQMLYAKLARPTPSTDPSDV